MNVRYTFDPAALERFQTARHTIYTKHGDCDDQATLLCSLLNSIGHESAIFLCDSDPKTPGRLSHAVAGVRLPRAVAPYGRNWIILETTKRVDFGWKVPTATRWDRIDINPEMLAKNELKDAPAIPNFKRVELGSEAM